MKRSFPINIAGKVYHIDEDAYELLDNYLSNLALTFSADDDKEIVADIECRISEIFSERVSGASQAITIKDVNDVIDIMGSPEQMAEGDPDSEERHHNEEQKSDSAKTTPPPFDGSQTQGSQTILKKKFYRDYKDRVLGGVVSGLCKYFDWSTPLVRFILVIAAFCFPVLIPVYIVAWMIFPAAITAQQQLEMEGYTVNVGNIGQTVKNQYAPAVSHDTSTIEVLGRVASAIAKIGLVILALIAIPVLISFVIGVVGLIVGLFLAPFHLMSDVIPQMFSYNIRNPYLVISALICWGFVVIIPCITIIWGTCNVFFNAKGSRKLITTSLILEMIFIILGTILGIICSLTFNF